MRCTGVLGMLAILLVGQMAAQQPRFREGVFLHHSTGGCIWGPNGSATSVPDQIATYNSFHGYTGSDSVSLEELSWPDNPWDNEWYRWHDIFRNQDPTADIQPHLSAHKIIIIKSCFPSSSIDSEGSAADTANKYYKSIYNYKWHWRDFISVMSSYQDNFFVIWTNAPLEAASTYPSHAALSDQFCRWAKDTLAAGLDPDFGPFPSNVYVFDFFHKLTGPDGIMLPQYAASPGNSHPSAAATELVAPLLVQEVFDAAIAYEQQSTGVRQDHGVLPTFFELAQNYPNPFNPATVITYAIPNVGTRLGVSVKVYDMLGREVTTLVDQELSAGSYSVVWNAAQQASGVYYCRLTAQAAGQADGFTATRSLVLLR